VTAREDDLTRDSRKATAIGAAGGLLLAGALACTALQGGGAVDEGAARLGEVAIQGDELMADIRALASDELAGRAPGTVGEERTIEWLTRALAEAGAQPGNPDGSWLQEVPLRGSTTKATARFRVGEQQMLPDVPEDLVAVTRQDLPRIELSGTEVVFAGYGVVAPEYGWDDFKGVDVRGKTVVVLVGDPPVPDPEDPTRLDPAMFRGEAMTYYGRWTYKYEIAAQLGAAACLIVHETGAAGYPWEVVAGGKTGEGFELAGAGAGERRLAVEGWITEQTARRLVRACGADLDTLEQRALGRGFQPVPLGARADFRLEIERREVRSHNIVGRIPGAGPRADEWVVYCAHWDHLGSDPAIEGDGVFNGALDNATGTAALVALARAYDALQQPPPRSILLLAVTAEESGLLGSRYYAEQPLYPLERTLVAVNMDGLNPWGRTRDVVSIGLGQTTLDPILEQEAARQSRVVRPDPEPGKGSFYRSDHFQFARRGVPVLYAKSGVEYVDRPEGWGLERRARYTAEAYHKPTDEVGEDWDPAGLVEDVRLYFRVGMRVAAARRWPEWLPGTEFRGLREAALLRAGAP
jgi:Zn-dependent M28 family amino/carboxypeptidase